VKSPGIKAGASAKADAAAQWYQEIFGEGNFYLEVQHNGIESRRRSTRRCWT
jgi:DNA polymerase III alpha subunit